MYITTVIACVTSSLHDKSASLNDTLHIQNTIVHSTTQTRKIIVRQVHSFLTTYRDRFYTPRFKPQVLNNKLQIQNCLNFITFSL